MVTFTSLQTRHHLHHNFRFTLITKTLDCLKFHAFGFFGQAEGKDVAMCKLDKDLIKATASLKGMTEAQAHCLQVFNECKSLVKWLRESMKSKLIINNQSYIVYNYIG